MSNQSVDTPNVATRTRHFGVARKDLRSRLAELVEPRADRDAPDFGSGFLYARQSCIMKGMISADTKAGLRAAVAFSVVVWAMVIALLVWLV